MADVDRTIRERLDARLITPGESMWEMLAVITAYSGALRAVLDLHRPYKFLEEATDACFHCNEPGTGDPKPWPCETVQAIATCLGVASKEDERGGGE